MDQGFSDVEKILSGGGLISTLIILGLRWLLGYKAKTDKENEELKAKNIAHQERRLEEAVQNFRSAIDSIREQFKDLTANLQMTRKETQSLATRIHDTEKLLQVYTTNFDGKIKNMVKTELIELGKQARMIRDKKNGQS